MEDDGLRLRLTSVREQQLAESNEPDTATVPTKSPTVSQDPDPHGHNEGEASSHVSLFETDEDNWDDVVSPRIDSSDLTPEPVVDERKMTKTSKFRHNPNRLVSSGIPAAVAESSVLQSINKPPDHALGPPPEPRTNLVDDEVQTAPVPQTSKPYVDDVDEILKEAYRDTDDVDKVLAEIEAVWSAQATTRKHLTSRPNRKPSRLGTEDEIFSSSTVSIPLGPSEASQSETLPNKLHEMHLQYPQQSNAGQRLDSLPQFVIGDDYIQNFTKDREVGYSGMNPSWEMSILAFLAVSIILIAIGLWKREVLKYVFHLKLGKGFDESVTLDYEKVLEEDSSPDSPRREVAHVQSSFTPPPVASAPRTRRNSGFQITLPASMGRRSATSASLPGSVASTPNSTRKSSRTKPVHQHTELPTDSLNGEMTGLPPSWDDFSIVGTTRKIVENSITPPPLGDSGCRHNHRSSNSFDPSLMGFVASLSGKGQGLSPDLMDIDVRLASEARCRGRQAITDLILTDARGNNLPIRKTEFSSPDVMTNLWMAENATSNMHPRRPLPFQLRAALGDLLPPVAASPLFPPNEGVYSGKSGGIFEAKYDSDTTTASSHVERSHYDSSLTSQNDAGNTGAKLRRTISVHSHLSSSLSNIHNEGLMGTPSSTRSASLSATSSPRGTPVCQKRSLSYSKPLQTTPSCPQLSNDESQDIPVRGRDRLRKDDQGGWQDNGWGDW